MSFSIPVAIQALLANPAVMHTFPPPGLGGRGTQGGGVGALGLAGFLDVLRSAQGGEAAAPPALGAGRGATPIQNGPVLRLDRLSVDEALLIGLSLADLPKSCPLAKLTPEQRISQIERYLGKAREADSGGLDALQQLLDKKKIGGGGEIPAWLASLLAGTIQGSKDATPDRVLGANLGQVQETKGNGSGSAGARGDLLRAVLQRLATLLDLLIEKAQSEIAKQDPNVAATETPAAPGDNRLPIGPTAPVGVPSRLPEALMRSDSSEPPRGNSPEPAASLPDLIYISGSQAKDGAVASSLAGAMRVRSLAGYSDDDPIRALRELLQQVRRLAEDPGDSTAAETLTDPGLRHLVLARLGADREGLAAPPPTDRAWALDAARATADQAMADRVEVVRQAQAAIADMVERMRGSVALDTPNRRAVIHLEPPALGRVHVNLLVDDGHRVVAHIAADHSATQDFLRSNHEDLRQGLMQQGFRRDQVEIRFADGEEGDFRRWLSSAAYAA